MSKALIGFHSIRQGLFQLSFIGKRSYTIQLTDRKVLKISGADSRKFLQGQCTNDINQLKTNGDSIAAAFLTTKGRIFSDAILYYHQSSPVIEGDILIEGNGKLITDLQKYLTLFKLRSKFTMEILNCKVFLNTDVINKQQLAEYQKQQSDKVLVSSLDPRIANYGCRVITSADAVLDVTVQDAVEYYHQIRDYLHGIADSLVIVNKIPFECNLDLLNYLNYHKGCYVGQELTARTKYKGVIRKRLLPFYVGAARNGFETVDKHQLLQHIISSEVTGFRAQVGDKVFGSSEPENSVGEIIAIDSKGRIGIAMVQLDVVYNHNGSYFVPFTTNNHTNSLQRDNLGITIFRPDWFIGLDEKTYLQKD